MKRQRKWRARKRFSLSSNKMHNLPNALNHNPHDCFFTSTYHLVVKKKFNRNVTTLLLADAIQKPKNRRRTMTKAKAEEGAGVRRSATQLRVALGVWARRRRGVNTGEGLRADLIYSDTRKNIRTSRFTGIGWYRCVWPLKNSSKRLDWIGGFIQEGSWPTQQRRLFTIPRPI